MPSNLLYASGFGLKLRRKSSKTCAEISASSAAIVSSGLWLMPPLPQRVNSIATSVIAAITIASCPAPELSSNGFRPHPGQIKAAAIVRHLLAGSTRTTHAARAVQLPEESRRTDIPYTARIQDVYSLRCAPQVYGPVFDALDYIDGIVAKEINSATNNPLIFSNEGGGFEIISDVWQGDLKSGKGMVSTQSGVLKETPYSFSARFENGAGTNPEELITAAHAGCFDEFAADAKKNCPVSRLLNAAINLQATLQV